MSNFLFAIVTLTAPDCIAILRPGLVSIVCRERQTHRSGPFDNLENPESSHPRDEFTFLPSVHKISDVY